MKKGFLKFFWISFEKAFGIPATIIAIALAVLFWILPTTKAVNIKWILPIGIFALLVIIALFDTTMQIYRTLRQLPSIIHAMKPQDENIKAEAVCLLEPSEFYSFEAMVSFYHITDEGFEQLIGVGIVNNIQEDGKIQVSLNYSLKGFDDLISKLANNDASIIKRILVKPLILKSMFGLIDTGGKL